jgi:hypothetical protein
VVRFQKQFFFKYFIFFRKMSSRINIAIQNERKSGKDGESIGKSSYDLDDLDMGFDVLHVLFSFLGNPFF